MEKKSDVPKATREAMRQLMGMQEIKNTFMTERGAGKADGSKTISQQVSKKIQGTAAASCD